MKALTVRQPHVELIFSGRKVYETRSWATKHRGPLAIHAGVTLDKTAMTRFAALLSADLQRGGIVGVVEIVDCIPVEDVTDTRFGDFSPGRWAWVLKDPRRLAVPVPALGRLGLWDVIL